MTLTQRFAALRATAQTIGESGKLDEGSVDLAIAVCADVVGIDVVDLRASGNGAVIIECGSGHTITIAPRVA